MFCIIHMFAYPVALFPIMPSARLHPEPILTCAISWKRIRSFACAPLTLISPYFTHRPATLSCTLPDPFANFILGNFILARHQCAALC